VTSQKKAPRRGRNVRLNLGLDVSKGAELCGDNFNKRERTFKIEQLLGHRDLRD
jgi:hypothetical protein